MKQKINLLILLSILFSLNIFIGCSDGSKIEGMIFDTVSKEPVADATVIAEAKIEIKEDKKKSKISSKTNSSGEFILNGLLPNYDYKITVTKEGYISDDQNIKSVEEGKTRLVEVSIFKKEPIRGLIVDIKGNPIPNVRTYIYNSNIFAISKKDGTFEIPFNDKFRTIWLNILNKKMKKEWWMPKRILRNIREEGCDFGEIKVDCEFIEGDNKIKTPDGRFIDYRDGTVADTKNNLVLQTFYGWMPKGIRPDKAKAHCDNMNYGGHKDWKLPSKKQLEEIFKSKYKSYFFTQNLHWASETEGKKRWWVDLKKGRTNKGMYSKLPCICVRNLN